MLLECLSLLLFTALILPQLCNSLVQAKIMLTELNRLNQLCDTLLMSCQRLVLEQSLPLTVHEYDDYMTYSIDLLDIKIMWFQLI